MLTERLKHLQIFCSLIEGTRTVTWPLATHKTYDPPRFHLYDGVHNNKMH